ncbi:hypothetical protein A3H80_01765 [Candidatus Roizmanbacteria bacterium RIFCSPLOWO2_02_FULL_37_19]|uniref:Bacterial Ig domain-containing protein n=1 Tax=Candidatus Roizmanbacteria bacterium RIFCSPHIGHO2_02_FULL_37_24 TaxID=1802037 RepID=A0A1F7GYB1_9BACT|nr:MAG: hypothetical protein A2862_00095 [Candidatus Roizmanbacteria bacterium RIFCSPHIGHO2_01_FULL_38_41]OGK23502.1 MAG: hypothetical protein A3C24_01765 [Candidatus Roizmanbacteria bacterium RIFCSPHIGHO2_02_FULL_37_24]OGK33460.1 MAG: hypothetical protein A3E10_02480 [Candidatus Roizmanbacteria bacterium RIFCSPHIGHO2_12_FULL_37_23]OGK43549.1 MAG: hypothetical protein A2956_02420 [Candidatus Roizmanbacteria bacterium RIFCSPLOWO2_01_FULL_37_57]OGK54038.1 MAG: hypothetical protein A3H80_01765 [Ca
MKKETLIAVILGIIAGIAIAVFIIKNSRDSSNKSADIILEQLTPTITIDTKKTEPLLIEEPDDGFVTEEESVTIKGTSQVNALIVLQTPQGEQILKTKNNSFTFDVDLLPGENKMKITSYSGKNIDARSLTVYSIQPE